MGENANVYEEEPLQWMHSSRLIGTDHPPTTLQPRYNAHDGSQAKRAL